MNDITAWLRLRNTARFSRQARSAARDIKGIGDAADEANGPLGGIGAAFKDMISNLPQLTGRTRLFGFAIGTVVTFLVAMLPIVVGVGGAIVALAGSLAVATIGAGLLAGAFGGVLAAALGGIGLVLFDALQNFQDVNQRFDTWRNAVKSFGADSTQAVTAFKRLSGVVSNSGGPAILEAVMGFRALRQEFQDAMQPVIGKLLGALNALFGAARKLLPTFVQFVDIVATALGPTLQLFISWLTGARFRSALIAIATSFAQLSGPLGRGIVLIFDGIVRLIVRMLPFLQPIASGFESIALAFDQWAQNGDLSPFLSQFQSWFNLLKAAGALLVTILSGGASSGQSLVDSLTGVLEKWNAFLNTPAGHAGLVKFFKDSVDMTKQFVIIVANIIGFIFRLGRAAVPLYTKAFKAMSDVFGQFLDALRPAKPFWDNVLFPLIKGLAIGIGGSLVGSFKFAIAVIRILANVLGFLGKILKPFAPIFQFLGTVIGFFFGGWILKVLSWLGKLSIVLRPLGFAFKLLGIPIRVAGALLGWLLGKGFALLKFFAGLGVKLIPVLGTAMAKLATWLVGLGGTFFRIGNQLWLSLKSGILQAVASGLGLAGDVGKAIVNALVDMLNFAIPNKIPIPGPIPDINLPDNPIPKLAMGGVVSGQGSWITGDAGPELNTLLNGRVTVQPLPAVSVPGPSSASLDTGGQRRVFVSKVYLRGRQIAEAVADEADDEIARR